MYFTFSLSQDQGFGYEKAVVIFPDTYVRLKEQGVQMENFPENPL